MTGLPRAWASKVAFAFLISFAFTLLTWGSSLGADQALFAYGGNVIRHGGTLYLDIWDKKQPGVYWLYAAAQAAFGEGWPGIRCLVEPRSRAASAARWLAAGGLPVREVAKTHRRPGGSSSGRRLSSGRRS